MEKFILFTLCFAVNSYVYSQTLSTFNLAENNTKALINDGGVFFNHPINDIPGYEVPAGSGLKTVYAMTFMYGAITQGSQLRFSGQTYTPLSDQFKGPLTADGLAQADQTGIWDANSLFPITKQEILDHIQNYNTLGYVMPSSIANWPAHGDVSLGFDFNLAPFIDVDGDNNYNPLFGDYPCIRGDRAVYVIMNDNADVHASGGQALGIEMHYLFYQYETTDDLNNTTFVHGKVINRSTEFLSDFKVGVWMDADLGCPFDDYYGSDNPRNIMYFYNGDNFDETCIGASGYEAAPPAFGVLALSTDFEHIGVMDNAFGMSPSTPLHFWNFMNGYNIDGSPWIEPIGGAQTNFMYPGDPADPTSQNVEAVAGNAPGDRRGLATINAGDLPAGSSRTFDFAFIYHEDGSNNIDNVTGLKTTAEFVQNFFDAQNEDCLSATSGLPQMDVTALSIYPNPTTGEFNISIGAQFSNAEVEIFDISGRSVTEPLKLTTTETAIRLDQPSGVYLVMLTIDGQKVVKHIILE